MKITEALLEHGDYLVILDAGGHYVMDLTWDEEFIYGLVPWATIPPTSKIDEFGSAIFPISAIRGMYLLPSDTHAALVNGRKEAQEKNETYKRQAAVWDKNQALVKLQTSTLKKISKHIDLEDEGEQWKE